MPTSNRSAFIPNAIRYFLRQDYPNKELLIVDDGTEDIAELIPNSNEIRYIRYSKHQTLGQKRNYCVEQCKGDLIMHWDDDDWMASHRISYQVRILLKQKADVCGLQKMFFCQPESQKCWLYEYPDNAKPWLAGGSLLYTRQFWADNPFPDIQIASDTTFILSRNSMSFAVLEDHSFYVASVHGSNTSPKRTDHRFWTPVALHEVKAIIGQDWSDYIHPLVSRETPVTTAIDGITSIRSTAPAIDKVSACLLSYKRVYNMQLIVDHLENIDFIDEIIIWNNDAQKTLNLTGNKVRIIHSPENRICYGRFLCAREARNEFIYVQDDDILVHNISELYQVFKTNPSQLVHALQVGHYQIRDQYAHFYGNGALVGWGAFFKKSCLSVLDQYLASKPEDYLFRREADLIFTLLLHQKHRTFLANTEPLKDQSTDGIALYKEPDHELYKSLAISKTLRFNRTKKEISYPVTWNIVIPCKNYGKYLKEAVDSILYNKADYQITIVDDGSTDDTETIGRQLSDTYSFIQYLRNEESKGVSHARNRGIAAVNSLFVVLLDADDKIGSNYLFEAEKALRKGYDVANPDAILFGDVNARWEVPDTVSLQMQIHRNYVHTCAAFRRSYWIQVGGIDERLANWQDYEFWIRLAAAGARIKRLTGDHFYYRKHGYSKSSESNRNREHIQAYIRTKHPRLYANH
jgi:glycosyltransferase involved in cell wall biosynthesis